jgi:hypothetical protein
MTISLQEGFLRLSGFRDACLALFSLPEHSEKRRAGDFITAGHVLVGSNRILVLCPPFHEIR